MIKFSRQRESIKNNLMGRTDHPTAETVYSDIRQEYQPGNGIPQSLSPGRFRRDSKDFNGKWAGPL